MRGCKVVTTSGACTSSPFCNTAPWTFPPRTMSRATRALVRISAPKLRAERAIASETAPMPPSG